MIESSAVQPQFETRLNLLSRQVYLLLEERGSLDLEEIGVALQVPGPRAALAVGWLARSRVVDLNEDGSGKLEVRIRRPID